MNHVGLSQLVAETLTRNRSCLDWISSSNRLGNEQILSILARWQTGVLGKGNWEYIYPIYTGVDEVNVIEIRLRFLPRDTPAMCEVDYCANSANYRMIITSNGKPEFTKLLCITDIVGILNQIDHNRAHMDSETPQFLPPAR